MQQPNDHTVYNLVTDSGGLSPYNVSVAGAGNYTIQSANQSSASNCLTGSMLLGSGSISGSCGSVKWDAGEVIMEEITADDIVEITPQMRTFMSRRVIYGLIESAYDTAKAIYRPEKPVAFDHFNTPTCPVSLVNSLGEILEPWVDYFYDQAESSIVLLRDTIYPLVLCYHEGLTFDVSKDLRWYQNMPNSVQNIPNPGSSSLATCNSLKQIVIQNHGNSLGIGTRYPS